jgi:hypothetical protein
MHASLINTLIIILKMISKIQYLKRRKCLTSLSEGEGTRVRCNKKSSPIGKDLKYNLREPACRQAG